MYNICAPLIELELVDFDDRVLRRNQLFLFAEVVKTTRVTFIWVGHIRNADTTVLGAKDVFALADPCTLFHQVELTIARKTTGFGTARRKTRREIVIGRIHN